MAAVRLLTAVPLLAACTERTPAPKMDVISATLTTTDGQYDFRTRSFSSDPDRETYNLTLLAAAPGLEVRIAPFGLSGKLQVRTETPDATVEFVADNVFYETDYRDQRMLGAFEDETYDLDGRPIPTLVYTVPERLANLLYTMSGRTVFTEDAADRIRDMRDEVHRFYFEFAVDGKPCVADVAVRLDVVMDVSDGVP